MIIQTQWVIMVVLSIQMAKKSLLLIIHNFNGAKVFFSRYVLLKNVNQLCKILIYR